jgi:hypothetical protein
MGPLFAALVGMSLLAAPSAAAAGTASAEPWQAAPSAIVQAVTEVPQSVFDAVGLQPNIADPVILRGQPPLTFDGKPGIFYEAAEPCPGSGVGPNWASPNRPRTTSIHPPRHSPSCGQRIQVPM